MNGKLHKVTHFNRARNIVKAWVYVDETTVTYIWTHLKISYERAWSTREVARLINRSQRQLKRYMVDGNIPKPQHTYLVDSPIKRVRAYLWSEKDIMRLHDYIMTVHTGRPRKDEEITPSSKTPSRAELRAMLKKDAVDYYVLVDGKMVRAWREEEW